MSARSSGTFCSPFEALARDPLGEGAIRLTGGDDLTEVSHDTGTVFSVPSAPELKSNACRSLVEDVEYVNLRQSNESPKVGRRLHVHQFLVVSVVGFTRAILNESTHDRIGHGCLIVHQVSECGNLLSGWWRSLFIAHGRDRKPSRSIRRSS
jgi:hypothetical protein